MNSARLHRILGLSLLLPLIGWAFTGFVFLLKPGYEGAYEQLSPRYYALDKALKIEPAEGWTEVRVRKTVLGLHLLVSTGDQHLHLDPITGQERPSPDRAELERLLEDAISANPERYGTLEEAISDGYVTSTGVELSLDWNKLTLRQTGRDTQIIGLLYKIHYLQWLGVKPANIALGVAGLCCLLLLVYCGVRIYAQGRRSEP